MKHTVVSSDDRLLTEAELYRQYIHMAVEKSSSVGIIERYVPEDLLWRGEAVQRTSFRAR